jgi:NAD(P)-dependent dehydrogenase (short-subunit alcohol dehydrogenase family)
MAAFSILLRLLLSEDLPNLFSYSAAKGGVTAITRQAATEYASCGITINSIAPGTIDTPILAGITDEMRAEFSAAHAIARLGTPSETLPIWRHTSLHPRQNSSLVKLFLATAVGRQNKKCGAVRPHTFSHTTPLRELH